MAATAGLKISRETPRQFVVLAVDQSRSVAADAAKIVQPFLDAATGQGRGGRAVSLPFAAEPGQLATQLSPPTDKNAPGTDLAAAITAARAAIPAGYVPQIVLFSDGNQTAGDALAAARAAGVPISTVPLPGPEHEVYVAGVAAPVAVRQGEPFDVDVAIQSTHDDSCTVELRSGSLGIDGATPARSASEGGVTEDPSVVHPRSRVGLVSPLGQQQAHVHRGSIHRGENHVRFPVTAAEGPAMTLSVRISGCQDTLAENNQGGAVVLVGRMPRVLLVESRPGAAAHLAEALGQEHVEVKVCLPEEIPRQAEALDRYDLVILSNIPATALPAERMESIGRYVGDFGGGLIVAGGDESFTPGGYRGTPLEDILPVRSEAKKNKPKPTLAMVLVLDCSGSMEGKSITLAKQAAGGAVKMLGPRDQVGVLAFEDKNWWVSPLHVCNDKDDILRRIDTIAAGGETDMYPALDKAYLALRESFADLKHIIVLTDGVSSPGDFGGLVKKIAADGITLSTVAVGEEAAGPLLKELAAEAKGHYYYAVDLARVPQIFALETSIAGKLGITEEPFFPQVVGAAPVLAGLDLEHAPTLLGYVETEPKPQSEVLLASKSGDPLLVCGRYGRGRTVAFTSDVREPLGGGLAALARLRPLLDPPGPPDDAQGAAARLPAPGRAGRRLGPGHARRLGPRRPIPQRRRGDAARDRSRRAGADAADGASGPRPLRRPHGDAVARGVLSGNEAAIPGATGGRPAAGDCAGFCRRVPHPAGRYGPSAKDRRFERRPLGPAASRAFHICRPHRAGDGSVLAGAADSRGRAVPDRFVIEAVGVAGALIEGRAKGADSCVNSPLPNSSWLRGS